MYKLYVLNDSAVLVIVVLFKYTFNVCCYLWTSDY